jgi:hypothetical protein
MVPVKWGSPSLLLYVVSGNYLWCYTGPCPYLPLWMWLCWFDVLFNCLLPLGWLSMNTELICCLWNCWLGWPCCLLYIACFFDLVVLPWCLVCCFFCCLCRFSLCWLGLLGLVLVNKDWYYHLTKILWPCQKCCIPWLCWVEWWYYLFSWFVCDAETDPGLAHLTYLLCCVAMLIHFGPCWSTHMFC